MAAALLRPPPRVAHCNKLPRHRLRWRQRLRAHRQRQRARVRLFRRDTRSPNLSSEPSLLPRGSTRPESTKRSSLTRPPRRQLDPRHQLYFDRVPFLLCDLSRRPDLPSLRALLPPPDDLDRVLPSRTVPVFPPPSRPRRILLRRLSRHLHQLDGFARSQAQTPKHVRQGPLAREPARRRGVGRIQQLPVDEERGMSEEQLDGELLLCRCGHQGGSVRPLPLLPREFDICNRLIPKRRVHLTFTASSPCYSLT